MGIKGIGMLEIAEMGREDGNGGIDMEITNRLTVHARCSMYYTCVY